MAALKGVKTLDMVGGEITKVAYEGAEYERVGGEANVGDIVLITDDSWCDATEGAFYLSIDISVGDPVIVDDIDEKDSYYSDGYALFRKKPVRLKVGDYAKVVGDTYNSDIVGGEIVKITDLEDGDGDLRFELVGDDAYDYAKLSSLEKVSAEEEKWAKIGRKVDEYKVGDIVAYDDPEWLKNKGIGKVTEDTDEDNYTRVVATDIRGRSIGIYLLPEKLTLITPVEARFDRS